MNQTYSLALNIKTALCNKVVAGLRTNRRIKATTSRGSQFTSDEYIGFVKSFKTIKISMDGKGRATDNVYIERFFRTIKYDKIYLEPPVDGLHLHKMCEQFIHFYNCKRSHSSIGKVPPIVTYRSAA